jgi:glucokinase
MSSEESHYVAVDIGGTQIRAACYRGSSQTLVELKRTPTRHPSELPLERLISLVKSIWPTEGQVRSIGVAAPGPIDPYEGIIFEAPNIPGWVNLPLRAELEKVFPAAVALGNDANLAVMGEWKFGAGQGYNDIIYLTVSTGIGGGVICDGKLLLGARGLAGEMGHVTLVPDGPLCGCGQRGHLEAFASGPAIAAWVEQELCQGMPSSLPSGVTITAKMVGEAAQQGDDLARAALARAGTYLGRAIADFAHIFNPSLVIIGGGVSRTGPLLLEPLQAALREHILSPSYVDNLKLTTAALGDEAGLTGALALALSTA